MHCERLWNFYRRGQGIVPPTPVKIDYRGIMRIDAYRDLKFCQDGVTVALTELEATLDTIEREIEQQKNK